MNKIMIYVLSGILSVFKKNGVSVVNDVNESGGQDAT